MSLFATPSLTPLLALPRAKAPLLAVCLLVWACGAHAGKGPGPLSAEQIKSLGIQTQAVAKSQGAWVSYPAETVIPPSQQRVVAAPTAGLVEALAVSAGEKVSNGQWLVRLRSPQAQELQRDVLQSGSQLDLAQRQAARDEALYQEGLIPLSRVEGSRAQLQQARAQAQERQSALLTSTGQRSPHGQGVVSLNAPIAGQVLEQMVAVGQRVEAAAPLYRIASLSPLWVDIQVPARETAHIKPGDAVQLPLPGGLGVVHARVSHLGAAVDTRSQSLTVRAQITPSGALPWRPGQLLQAQLQRSTEGTTVSLPAAALMPAPAGKQQVFVQTGKDRFEAVEVALVSRDGDVATVTGLKTDARVVVKGTAALKALMGS